MQLLEECECVEVLLKKVQRMESNKIRRMMEFFCLFYSRFRVGDECGLGFFCLSLDRTVVGSFFGDVGAGGFLVSTSCAVVLFNFLLPFFLSGAF